MEGLAQLSGALLDLLRVSALFNVAWATLLGIVVGALPGLTATLGVALLTTLTYKMAPDQAILVLICM
jgi:putative tricarboxylic transport membrane protein